MAKEAPKELTPQQAINILVQAVQLAQKSGVYSLDDAALIKTAVDVFVKKEEQPKVEAKAEVKTEAVAETPVTEEKK